MNLVFRMAIVPALAAVLLLAGCSGDGLETVPVYGKLTFVGRDVPETCRLFFRPVETVSVTRPSTAAVKPDGSYEVKAFQHSNGLIPGTYQVRVSYSDLKPGANPNLETSWIQSGYDAGELVVESGSSGVEHNIEVPPKSLGNTVNSFDAAQ